MPGANIVPAHGTSAGEEGGRNDQGPALAADRPRVRRTDDPELRPGGRNPGRHAAGSKIISFYTADEGKLIAVSVLLAYAAAFFLFFVGHLRGVLRSAEDSPGTLSAVAFGGGVVAAVGILLFAGLNLTLADTADKLEPGAAQAINALGSNMFFPLAAGMGSFLVATAATALRTRALPRWLAWPAIVIGIAVLSPIGFFGLLASLLWFIVVSITLSVRARAAAAA
jgi:hypothetical protein